MIYGSSHRRFHEAYRPTEPTLAKSTSEGIQQIVNLYMNRRVACQLMRKGYMACKLRPVVYKLSAVRATSCIALLRR